MAAPRHQLTLARQLTARVFAAGLFLLVDREAGSARAATPAATRVDCARDTQPILASHCYDCHGPQKTKGGLQLTSLISALKGGESGEPAIIPGDAGKSALIHRVTTEDENDVMPQKGDRLSSHQVALLRRWINEGSVWPENVK